MWRDAVEPEPGRADHGGEHVGDAQAGSDVTDTRAVRELEDPATDRVRPFVVARLS